MRSAVVVDEARADELDELVAVCLEARAESATGIQVCSPDARAVAVQLGVLLSVPGGAALVARLDGRVVGFALLRLVGPSPFLEERVLYLEALYVAAGARRRGVGHALLAATAQRAAEAHATDVLAVPIPGARGVQRFLARIGFAPAASHRMVSTTTLLRRLAAEAHPASGRVGGRQPRGLEELIARRRRTRAEGASGPIDLRAVQRRTQETAGTGETAAPVPAARERRDDARVDGRLAG